jgi:LAO/AO transport system kinase
MHPLARRVLDRDPRAVARTMRLVDDRAGDFAQVLKDLFSHTGKAWIIGVTGNPGAGKSTLSDRLIDAFRKEGKRVGVVCVDPTSPYSGGAILGDRIRMSRHFTDDEVFIRSVATRGHLGGLSRSARDIVRVLDAWGADVVLVETVGVGQDELEITRTAHTTLVVMAPGLGDEVQALKAGIMEVADVFVVNKADRDGADATVRDVELMIALGGESLAARAKRGTERPGGDERTRNDKLVAAARSRGHVGAKIAMPVAGVGAGEDGGSWTPPVLKCVAVRGEGMAELVDKLRAHHAWVQTSEEGKARRRARLADEMREALREALIEAAASDLAGEIEEAVRAVDARATDPYTATERLVARFRGGARVAGS